LEEFRRELNEIEKVVNAWKMEDLKKSLDQEAKIYGKEKPKGRR